MADMNITIPQLDKDITMCLFKKFAKVSEVDAKVEAYVIASGDAFWEFMVQTWESYAIHAGRNHLEKSDIQLHMLRTDLIKDYNDFSALVVKYLPMDLVYEVLEIAQAKDLAPQTSSRRQQSPKLQTSRNMSVGSYSAGQIYARRKLFSPVPRRLKNCGKSRKKSSKNVRQQDTDSIIVSDD